LKVTKQNLFSRLDAPPFDLVEERHVVRGALVPGSPAFPASPQGRVQVVLNGCELNLPLRVRRGLFFKLREFVLN